MKYADTVRGEFVRRLNRFAAEVAVGGITEIAHVKNSGRLKELLVPGAEIILERPANLQRKTKYSVIAAKKNGAWVNVDSQAPNAVVHEALLAGRIPEISPVTHVKREVSWGGSRFDLYFEGGGRKGFIEVKGVTLEQDGVALFPDAPTERGAKHIRELAAAVQAGYAGIAFFLLQRNDCRAFSPHEQMDKPFAGALRQAAQAGVQIVAYDSVVTEDEIVIGKPVEVQLGK